jgi:hypothetical protein
MIDSLYLTLGDYEVASAPKLRVQPAPFDAETGAQLPSCRLWSTRGGGVEGVKAYHNSDSMQVTLRPMSGGGAAGDGEFAPLCLVGSAPRVLCHVNFSVPKRSGGNNYMAVGFDESKAAVRGVERELRDIGIRTNIERATVSRLDAFRNVITDEPFPAYQRVFAQLQAKRMQKRDYGTTYLWHNTQQECCVYDKLAEMAARKVDVTSYPQNTMRFEHRMLNGRKVRDTLGGVRSVGDLWQGFGTVPAAFEKAMRSNLFRYPVTELEIQTGNELMGLMRTFKQRGRRYWFEDFLRAKGFDWLLQQAETETILEAAARVASEGASDSQARVVRYRLARKIQQAQLDLEFVKPFNGGARKTIGALYRELESKVFQLAA